MNCYSTKQRFEKTHTSRRASCVCRLVQKPERTSAPYCLTPFSASVFVFRVLPALGPAAAGHGLFGCSSNRITQLTQPWPPLCLMRFLPFWASILQWEVLQKKCLWVWSQPPGTSPVKNLIGVQSVTLAVRVNSAPSSSTPRLYSRWALAVCLPPFRVRPPGLAGFLFPRRSLARAGGPPGLPDRPRPASRRVFAGPRCRRECALNNRLRWPTIKATMRTQACRVRADSWVPLGNLA